jgi:hypothetical protein
VCRRFESCRGHHIGAGQSRVQLARTYTSTTFGPREVRGSARPRRCGRDGVQFVAEEVPVAVERQHRGRMAEHALHADGDSRRDREGRRRVPEFVRNAFFSKARSANQNGESRLCAGASSGARTR